MSRGMVLAWFIILTSPSLISSLFFVSSISYGPTLLYMHQEILYTSQVSHATILNSIIKCQIRLSCDFFFKKKILLFISHVNCCSQGLKNLPSQLAFEPALTRFYHLNLYVRRAQGLLWKFIFVVDLSSFLLPNTNVC